MAIIPFESLSTESRVVLKKIDFHMNHTLKHLNSSSTKMMTDFGLCLSMIDSMIDVTNFDHQIIDIACGKGSFGIAAIYRLIENGWPVQRAVDNIYLIDNDPSQIRHCRINIKRLTGYESKNIMLTDSLKWEPHMKFHTTIANPPYKAGLHLDFLKKALEISDNVCFVHPGEWIIAKRDSPKKQKYDILKECIGDNITVEFIDDPFNINIFAPLCITHISDNLKGTTFIDSRSPDKFCSYEKLTVNDADLNNITRVGYFEDGDSILKKVSGKLNGSWKPHLKANNNKYYVNLMKLVGNGFTTFTYSDGVTRTISNLYSLVNSHTSEITTEPGFARPSTTSSQEKKDSGIGNSRHWVSFEKKEEAENALNFITKTKFMRSYLALIRIDQHAADICLGYLPWLDWSKNWSDEDINIYFGFNKSEVNMIEEIVKRISNNKSG